jgi:ABC-type transport system involved in cytochrome c biogenesis permease subunit
MRKSIQAILMMLLWVAPALAGGPPEINFDWEPWRYLPVQEGGRQKPLDTLARESVRMMTNRAGMLDPETGQYLDAAALYLTMLFDWQGWNQPAGTPPPADNDLSTEYLRLHKPDKWDHAPLLWVESKELRKAIGLAESQAYISPFELKDAKFIDPQTAEKTPFLDWAEKLDRKNRNDLSDLEKKGPDLAERYFAYMLHRMGRRLEILPLQGNPHKQWASLATLMFSKLDDKNDPRGDLRKARDAFLKARTAHQDHNLQAFNEASADFLASMRSVGPEQGDYPAPQTIALEVTYNHWAPFRLAWILSLFALICVLPSKLLNWKPLYVISMSIFAAAVAAMFAGFAVRCVIAERPPITNMYESVLSVGVGIAVLGLIYELIYRKRYLLIAASVLSALVLILAESCPSLFDASIHPLPAVLRNRFWLWVHVVPIMVSYAAFAVAWILANVSLGGYMSGNAGSEFMNALSKLMLKIIRIGVFLLTAGTILGGLWADYSWGRFWGWDPKEVWALISLLFYLNILHARYVGWLADFGTTVWTVISFVAVIMTWYGVNFELGSGLHSYGAGAGGVRIYVLGALLVQIVYLAAAIAGYFRSDSAAK